MSSSTPSQAEQWKLLEVRPAAPGHGRLVCVVNQKGGVGKTTTTVNLGAALALRRHRVLIVDLDPQANATTGLGIDHRTVGGSTYDLLTGSAGPEDVILRTAIEGLECAPAVPNLAGAEIELVGSMAREHKLAEVLAPLAERYETVFIDCPPALGLLTVNALVAAQDLLVPVQCEYYALEALGHLLGTAERIRRALNSDLRIAGFLLTMYDARTRLAEQVASEVRSHFGRLVFDTVVPRSVRLSEAPSFGEPVLTLDPASRGATAYRMLAAEVEARYGLPVHVPPAPPRPAAPRGGATGRPVLTAHPGGLSSDASVGRFDHPSPQAAGGDEDGSGVPAAATPGPGGRGYGTRTPRPPGLEESWPRTEPWL